MIHLNVVVLPAPFNPKRPKHSPRFIQKFKFLIAITSLFAFLKQPFLYIFLKFFTLTANISLLFILFRLLFIIFEFVFISFVVVSSLKDKSLSEILLALSISSKTK